MNTTVQVWTVHVTRGEYAGRCYTFKSAAAARRKRDRLDFQYGAVCSHIVIPRADSVQSDLLTGGKHAA